MRPYVIMVVKMSMLVFWIATPCALVCKYKRFEERTSSIFRAELIDVL